MKDIKDYLSLTIKNILTYIALAAGIIAILTVKGTFSLTVQYRWLIVGTCIIIPLIISAFRLIKSKNKEINTKNAEIRLKNEEIEAKDAEIGLKNEEIKATKKTSAESLLFPVKKYSHAADKDLFYIDYSEYLPEDTIVSIYYKDTNNKLVCCGRVLDVEPACFITIEVIQCTVKDGREHYFTTIKTTDVEILDKVFIKLLVKYEAVQKLATEMKGE